MITRNLNSLLLTIIGLLTISFITGTNASPEGGNQQSSVNAPSKKPNIIVILADDMGYSDIGCFGSEIQTPNLDALGRKGLRMSQFYNASRCCPTRASLLTGLYQHQAGVGEMVNNRNLPAYQGYLNKQCVTIAEALRDGGYTTLMAGKWHVGTAKEHWPRQRGFDRYYGLIDGASSYFSFTPYRPGQKLTLALDDQPTDPGAGFYATNAYTDYALKFISENPTTQKPFFLYLAYTAPHWPLHALPEDIARYKGKYDKGWDILREERFRRLKEEGIIDQNTKLSPRDPHVPAWETVPEDEKSAWKDKMSVYAAMVDRMDQNIGRLLGKLKETGDDKNTMILFLSDNGASHESIGGAAFTEDIAAASKKPASDPSSFTAYGMPGANLSNTPFRLFKHWEYEGGNATPFIAYYPAMIKSGKIDHRPAHIIDIMATCLELAGVKYPREYKGHSITPSDGVSLLPVFKGASWKGHDALYFEHVGNRAVRQGSWKLVSNYQEDQWHLYNVENDRSELLDLAAGKPEKVTEMIKLYDEWAKRAGVIPYGQVTKVQAPKKAGT